MKGKKKASATTYDSEEPTEQEMSVRNMCHGCLFTYIIAVLPVSFYEQWSSSPLMSRASCNKSWIMAPEDEPLIGYLWKKVFFAGHV